MDIVSLMTPALESVKSMILQIIVICLPYVLGFLAITVGIPFAFNLFRTLVGEKGLQTEFEYDEYGEVAAIRYEYDDDEFELPGVDDDLYHQQYYDMINEDIENGIDYDNMPSVFDEMASDGDYEMDNDYLEPYEVTEYWSGDEWVHPDDMLDDIDDDDNWYIEHDGQNFLNQDDIDRYERDKLDDDDDDDDEPDYDESDDGGGFD